MAWRTNNLVYEKVLHGLVGIPGHLFKQPVSFRFSIVEQNWLELQKRKRIAKGRDFRKIARIHLPGPHVCFGWCETLNLSLWCKCLLVASDFPKKNRCLRDPAVERCNKSMNQWTTHEDSVERSSDLDQVFCKLRLRFHWRKVGKTVLRPGLRPGQLTPIRLLGMICFRGSGASGKWWPRNRRALLTTWG